MNNKMEVFNNLVSLDPKEYENIYEILEENSSRIGKYLFPFGEDPFGNLLCIDYSDNQSIVFWNHEINYEEFIGTSYMCKGFTEFIAQLR
ncbi:SMI1/KNR4 family protein [Streptococcus cuniculi]